MQLSRSYGVPELRMDIEKLRREADPKLESLHGLGYRVTRCRN